MPAREINIDVTPKPAPDEWTDAYLDLLETAWRTVNAIRTADLITEPADTTEALDTIRTLTALAAEIREGLAADLLRHPGQPPRNPFTRTGEGRQYFNPQNLHYDPAGPTVPADHCTFCLQFGHTADAHGQAVATGAICCEYAPHVDRLAAVRAHPLRPDGDDRGERWGPQA